MNQNIYDKNYYDYYGGQGPYDRNREEWLSFFANIGDRIKEKISPKKVLDVGCAKGFLVEALRERGVDAFGVDISDYAISQVRDDIKPYCSVRSATEPFQDSYDLIVCIEVLEHLSEEEGCRVIENMCAHTTDVVFSSTPSHEHPDPTHQNVRPKEHWIKLFAENSFTVDREFDGSFITPHAMRFKKKVFDITFVSPGAGISGGVKVIFEYCNRLSFTGHHINLVILSDESINWFEIDPEVKIVRSSYDPKEFNRNVPNADIIIAAGAMIAPLVAQSSEEKGRKFYLVQGYESAVFSTPEQTDYTYRLPLQKIVVSSWLKTVIEDISREKAELIFSGIDFSQFHPIENHRGRYPESDIRIGMIYGAAKYKGFDDGLQAIEIIRREHPEVKLILMSSESVPQGVRYDELWESPPQGEIKHFYNSLDIFVSSSRLEGFYLPGLEAMTCGTPVVTTDAGGNRDYAIHGRTALISPPGEIKSLARNIEKVIKDKNLARTLKDNALEMASYFTWDRSIKSIQKVFIESDAFIRISDPNLIGYYVREISQTKQKLWELETQAIAKRDKLVSSLNLIMAKQHNQITAINQTIAKRDKQIAALNALVKGKESRVRSSKEVIREIVREKDSQIASLSQSVAERDTQIILLSQAIAKRDGQIAAWNYLKWVRLYDTLTDETRAKMRHMAGDFALKPLISVVMPCYNPKPEWLKEAIESVRRQVYPHWELCIADDASTDPAIRPILEDYARRDVRIKVVFRKTNGHISAASNSALTLATGEYVALLDHDDLLAEQALFWVAEALNRHPDAGLIYSDEDKITEFGLRLDPYFKCDWNYDLFLSQNMITHLGVYKTELLQKIGGFREGFEGSQDYDLALRCIEQLDASQIIHIPRVLYHWRMHQASAAQNTQSKPYAYVAAERALNEHLARKGVSARAERHPESRGFYRVRYALPTPAPLVTLIIPTRNSLHLIRRCLSSILEKTDYPNYEILIINNGSDDPQTLAYFDIIRSDPRFLILRDDRPFNYSALNNRAVQAAQGELVGLINNGIEVISPEWLSEMVSIALQSEVGAVGARLWHPDNTLQHGGVILAGSGIIGHSHKFLPKGYPGYFGRAILQQSFSAVTAACLVIRRSIFLEVGGFEEENLKVAFGDVDFCLRVREAGYRNVWTPYAEAYHRESATRGYEDTPEKQARLAAEARYMQDRWGSLLFNDPVYSPNLTITREGFSYASPPRVTPFEDLHKPNYLCPRSAAEQFTYADTDPCPLGQNRTV
jgi:glycosyltransferase involved in cell wall biosynthesis